MNGADGVGDAVRAHLERIAIPDLQACLRPRLEDERIDAEVLAAAAPQRVDHLGNHGTERDLPDTASDRRRFPAARRAGTVRARRTTLAAATACGTASSARPSRTRRRRSDCCRRRASGSSPASERDVVDQPHVAEPHGSEPAAVPVFDVVDGEPCRAQIPSRGIGGRRGRQDAVEARARAARSAGDRRRFRELSARPSASRTVGHATIAVGRKNASAMPRTSVSCCQSFSPK